MNKFLYSAKKLKKNNERFNCKCQEKVHGQNIKIKCALLRNFKTQTVFLRMTKYGPNIGSVVTFSHKVKRPNFCLNKKIWSKIACHNQFQFTFYDLISFRCSIFRVSL